MVFMKKILLLASVMVLFAAVVFAAGPKSYQVTGPVLEITDDVIIVQKGKDKWELAKSPATNVAGDLKVGAKVTIDYKMTAEKITVKEEKQKTTRKK
jgi:hypothetical protein